MVDHDDGVGAEDDPSGISLRDNPRFFARQAFGVVIGGLSRHHFFRDIGHIHGERNPRTAQKLGKDLWAVGGEHQTMYAYELLDAAYAALGRDVPRQVLRTHREHRDLPSVDIFDAEA